MPQYFMNVNILYLDMNAKICFDSNTLNELTNIRVLYVIYSVENVYKISVLNT